MTTTSDRGRGRRRPKSTELIERALPGLAVRGSAAEPLAAKRKRAVLRKNESAALWGKLESDARRIAARFDLRFTKIEPEREGVKAHYGVCYSDGTIRIRLRHASTGRALKYSSLINTVCHELAHLVHFNHGERFKAFYFHILDWARSEGIYRPSTTDPLPPVQLGLFTGKDRCGLGRE